MEARRGEQNVRDNQRDHIGVKLVQKRIRDTPEHNGGMALPTLHTLLHISTYVTHIPRQAPFSFSPEDS